MRTRDWSEAALLETVRAAATRGTIPASAYRALEHVKPEELKALAELPADTTRRVVGIRRDGRRAARAEMSGCSPRQISRQRNLGWFNLPQVRFTRD